jgi:hypothetical protein
MQMHPEVAARVARTRHNMLIAEADLIRRGRLARSARRVARVRRIDTDPERRG